MFYAIVLGVGIVAAFRLGRSTLPPISVPVVTIAASYPGAAPDEMERLIVEPIEDELNGLNQVARVSAWAQRGTATLSVEFRFGTNIDADRANVQQAVDAARVNLPSDALPPRVSTVDLSQAPAMEEAISSAILSRSEVSDRVSLRILPALRSTAGIGNVSALGLLTPQLQVTPVAAQLDALHATALDVLHAVSAGQTVAPGGTLRTPLREAGLGIDASATTTQALAALPLAIPGAGAARVGDVARVSESFADPSVLGAVDGEPSVVISIAPGSNEDALRAVAAARATLRRLSERMPLLRFEEVRTDEPSTNAAIGGVAQTLGEGVLLTTIVMLLFLHAWRHAVVAAVAIPASLCATFAAMWLLGISFNVLSLMGLSLTIGILVDDSIVIIEAITEAAARGLSAPAAALAGRRELGGAAFAMTLIDIAVFAPIAMMSGLIGEFMRQFALVVVVATAFSLLVSFTITPVLAGRWALRSRSFSLDGLSLRDIRSVLQARARTFPWTFRSAFARDLFAGWHAALNGWQKLQRRLARRYSLRWLSRCLRKPVRVLFAVALPCAAAILPLLLGWIPGEFSPPVNRGIVTLNMTLPGGTPLAATDAAARRMASALMDDNAVRHVESSAGRASDGDEDVVASNVAQLGIVLSDPMANGQQAIAEAKSLAKLAPSASLTAAGQGMGGHPPISYTVSGDAGAMNASVARIAAALRSNRYASDVVTSDAGLAPRVQMTVDSAKAALLGVSPDDAARTARIATGGMVAAKARVPSGFIDVVVRSGDASSRNLAAAGGFTVRAANGTVVPLLDLTRSVETSEPAVIGREDGRRVVSVSANTRDGAPVGLVAEPMRKALRDPNFLPAGASIEPRGDIAQFFDTVSKILAALGVSILTVYAILAVLYRSYGLPLVVMATVPLAAIGSLGTLFALNVLRNAFPAAHFLEGQTLNLYSMLGIVMLVGLVAKNGILLVEFAERGRRQGLDPEHAIIAAAKRRFRPVLMTTLAMIAGMLPLAVGDTIGAEYRKALGSVVVGGLSSSLLLTMIVVPAAYVLLNRRALRSQARTFPSPALSRHVADFSDAAVEVR